MQFNFIGSHHLPLAMCLPVHGILEVAYTTVLKWFSNGRGSSTALPQWALHGQVVQLGQGKGITDLPGCAPTSALPA